MERPFFSLAKRKRVKPIEYTSPDGQLYVTVSANPRYGMATIWDADILIYAVSQLVEQKKRHRQNDIPRTIRVEAYKRLKAIGRGTGGAQYKRLQVALARLQSTTIETNIRAGSNKRIMFSWIDSVEDEVRDAELERGMVTLTVSNWMYQGVLDHEAYLLLNPKYFGITGGLERVLYRIARKHAGEKPTGQLLKFETLRLKTGSDEAPNKFAARLRRIVTENRLPDYDMQLMVASDGAPGVHFLHEKFDREDVAASKLERRITVAEARQMADAAARRGYEDAKRDFIDRVVTPEA